MQHVHVADRHARPAKSTPPSGIAAARSRAIRPSNGSSHESSSESTATRTSGPVPFVDRLRSGCGQSTFASAGRSGVSDGSSLMVIVARRSGSATSSRPGRRSAAGRHSGRVPGSRAMSARRRTWMTRSGGSARGPASAAASRRRGRLLCDRPPHVTKTGSGSASSGHLALAQLDQSVGRTRRRPATTTTRCRCCSPHGETPAASCPGAVAVRRVVRSSPRRSDPPAGATAPKRQGSGGLARAACCAEGNAANRSASTTGPFMVRSPDAGCRKTT